MKDLERVQKRALSIICPLSDYDTALQSLGIEQLHTHHQQICVDLFGKIEKDENHRLGSLLPPKRDIHYELRNAKFIILSGRLVVLRTHFLYNLCYSKK